MRHPPFSSYIVSDATDVLFRWLGRLLYKHGVRDRISSVDLNSFRRYENGCQTAVMSDFLEKAAPLRVLKCLRYDTIMNDDCEDVRSEIG